MKGVRKNKLIRFGRSSLVTVAGLGICCGVAALTALLAPAPSASAAAGSGSGEGGLPGCGSGKFLTTCTGASWEWYEWPEGHHGDLYIRGTDVIGGGYDKRISPSGYISGECESAGGYWRYAMIAQLSYYGWSPGQQVGISSISGNHMSATRYWYKSVYFGGGMNYRGHDWWDVKAKFDEAQAAGFNNGFTWDANSNLGWFCYGPGVTGYETEWESDTTATLSQNGTTVYTGTSPRASQYNPNTSVTINSAPIKVSEYSDATITWNHNLYRVDNEKKHGEANYQVERTGSGLLAGPTNASTPYGPYELKNIVEKTAKVGNLGVPVGSQNYSVCEWINHDATARMINEGTQYQSMDNRAQSQACLLFNNPLNVTIGEVESSVDPLYIGEQGTYKYSVEANVNIPREPYDRDGDGELEAPPPKPEYKVFGFWADLDGEDSGGNVLSGGYGPREISGPNCNGIGITSTVKDCQEVDSGWFYSSFSGSGEVDVPDEEKYVGAKYCVAVVHNYFSASGTYEGYDEGASIWGLRQVSCSPTYKKPNFRITGAQAFTAGGIDSTIVAKTTSGYDSTGKFFGSWSEYNLAAGGSVNNFGTGAYPSFGAPTNYSPIDVNDPYKVLAIANRSNPPGNSGVDTGSQALLAKLDNYLAKIKNLGGLTTVNQGGLSFSCSAIHSICIYTGGSVTINSNIGAGGDYPIYVVRASGDINIAEGVSNIEAWLISDGGTINTCAGKNSIEDLSHSICNTQLTIDGPVYGSSLKLMRTGGANGVTRSIGSARESDAESAETINYPAKTYVWSYEESTSSDVRLYESGSIELAPRV